MVECDSPVVKVAKSCSCCGGVKLRGESLGMVIRGGESVSKVERVGERVGKVGRGECK